MVWNTYQYGHGSYTSLATQVSVPPQDLLLRRHTKKRVSVLPLLKVLLIRFISSFISYVRLPHFNSSSTLRWLGWQRTFANIFHYILHPRTHVKDHASSQLYRQGQGQGDKLACAARQQSEAFDSVATHVLDVRNVFASERMSHSLLTCRLNLWRSWLRFGTRIGAAFAVLSWIRQSDNFLQPDPKHDRHGRQRITLLAVRLAGISFLLSQSGGGNLRQQWWWTEGIDSFAATQLSWDDLLIEVTHSLLHVHHCHLALICI